MRLRKFTAKNMKDALQLVKNELGSDAVILSTRKMKNADGSSELEITAAVDRAATPAPSQIEETVNLFSREEQQKEKQSNKNGIADLLQAHGVHTDITAKIVKAADALSETGFAHNDTLEMVLGKMIPFQPPARAMGKKKVHVFVGPTGAGKTTTISKLAVEKKLSGSSVGLISMDFLKVGGYDQLATFAGAMKEQAFLIREITDFEAAWPKIQSSDYVFIDTPGINPFNRQQVTTLTKRLNEFGIDAEVHLVLPASMDPEALSTCPIAFGGFAPNSLIFTKIDESFRLGGLVNTAASSGLSVCYMTDGAHVPDDIIEMDSRTLATKLTTMPKYPWEN